jgi:hypothetical protein
MMMVVLMMIMMMMIMMMMMMVVVGLGRVVRKVRQHPEDHEFESQRWQ